MIGSLNAKLSEPIAVLQPFMADAIVIGCLYALMSMGLTLTYMTTKVPNFAHGSFVTVGVYLAFTLYHFDKVLAYYSIPFSFLLVGGTAVAIYRFVLKPLSARGASIVSLMISTLAIDIAFIGIFGIYSDLLANNYKIFNSRFFLLADSDISILGLRGLTIIAPFFLALVTVILWLALTKTKFGIAMRAAVENPNLAGVLGINIERVYLASWFLAGGLAGLAGSLMVLWLPGNPHVGSDLIVAIFASSILGGLFSVYGAVVGGLMVGGLTVLVTVYGSQLLGSWVDAWEVGIPMLIMAFSLLIVPKGITAVDWRHLFASSRKR
jgi:branched-chain amino acid transport system permease protein